MIQFSSSPKFNKKGAIVFVSPEQIRSKKFPFDYQNLIDEIVSLNQANQFKAEKGECFPLASKKQVVLLVGVGKEKDLSLTAFRMIVRRAFLSSVFKRVDEIEVISHSDNLDTLKSIVEGIKIGGYKWSKYLSAAKNQKPKKAIIVAQANKALKDVVSICDGVNLTRDLVNDNADTVDAKYFESLVRKLTRNQKNVRVEILNKKQLQTKKLGFHLAVNQGSKKEPKLIIVKYTGAAKTSGYTALIGKGITFDTGGLNLKPTGNIETMKFDMGGAAAVMGALKNTLALKPKKNVIFAFGMAENAIGSNAYKPGDVIKGYAGKTVEVGNTDAEGRLVLADAISYVSKNYKPKRIIDVATLTGACMIALGFDYTGLMSNNQKFADQLLEVANDTDDRTWQLPSYPELSGYVKSQIADLKNLGVHRSAGGALTAGEFLRQFLNKEEWAHLDIAGTVYVEQKERFYFGHGATGAGVRLLTNFILKY